MAWFTKENKDNGWHLDAALRKMKNIEEIVLHDSHFRKKACDRLMECLTDIKANNPLLKKVNLLDAGYDDNKNFSVSAKSHVANLEA